MFPEATPVAVTPRKLFSMNDFRSKFLASAVTLVPTKLTDNPSAVAPSDCVTWLSWKSKAPTALLAIVSSTPPFRVAVTTLLPMFKANESNAAFVGRSVNVSEIPCRRFGAEPPLMVFPVISARKLVSA